MPEEDLVDIKFRLYDGSDMGPFRYSSAATVDMLKQRIVSDWPKGQCQFSSHKLVGDAILLTLSLPFVLEADCYLCFSDIVIFKF